MNVLGATTIWVWWCVMMLIVVWTSSAAMEFEPEEEVSKQLNRYTTVTYKFGTTDYAEFLNTLRNNVGENRSCYILSTRSNPSPSVAYILVKLQVSGTQFVTLGIDAKDLYVWAYQNSVQQSGKYLTTFLKDAPAAARNSLFSGSTVRNTTFGGNYNDLEAAAHTSRKSIPLTFESLKNDVLSFYGVGNTAPSSEKEAKFFLRAIQMVPESARFRFIQKTIRDGKADDTAFRNKLIAYETNWDKISEAIHKASPRCQTITPPLLISTFDYRQVVNDVNEIKNDMGLLKYKESTLRTVTLLPPLFLAHE